MADPADLLKAWQHAIRDLGGVTASLASGPAGAASDLVRPLQHQAELLQQVLQRQLQFERELVSRAVAPLHAAQELIDQATGVERHLSSASQPGFASLRFGIVVSRGSDPAYCTFSAYLGCTPLTSARAQSVGESSGSAAERGGVS